MNRSTKQTRPMSQARTAHEQMQQRALRRSLGFIAFVAALIIVFAAWLNRPEPERETTQTEITLPDIRQTDAVEIPEIHFSDVTSEAGITFTHQNGANGEKLLPETMGSGCALFDFDQDGDSDILLINGDYWPWDDRRDREPRPSMSLYRNDGDWRFVDATEDAGLGVSFFGMGVSAADFDNDGDNDLFVTAVGQNHLFRNDDGHFVDITQSAGVAGADDDWSSGCAWLDYNNDGLLDLFVANYVQWSKQLDLAQDFSLDGTNRAYGPPIAFQGTFPYLYRNEGNSRFTDISEETGIRITNPATGVPMAKSLGIAPVDLDRDGWIDLIIANDTVQNFVFHNAHGKAFEEIGSLAGIAFDGAGQARGAMGIDSGRFRNDQTVGIAVGNFANEMTALYVSLDDPLQFFDAGIATGLGPPTRLDLTFGVFFFDCDLDGRLDLLAANGHLEEEINTVQESQHYEQPPDLFWNGGDEHSCEFVEVPKSKTGADFCRPMVGRGSAFADLDGDGDEDVLITANGGPPRLLRNDQDTGHHWIRFRLRGTTSNRNAIGTWIEVHANNQVLLRHVMPTRSYLSQSDSAITVGLGLADTVDSTTIHWPDGTTQKITSLSIDQTHVIEQPAGETD